MKLAVLGGGGVRTPFLAKSLAVGAKTAGISRLVLMDNDARKLHTYGAIAREIAKRIAPDLSVSLTTDRVEAVRDADYIITTIRAEGDEGRAFDEEQSLAHGVLGQETTGASGFAMAMRSIPVLIEYCRLIRLHAKPDAVVFNFSNPSGLVTQALRYQGFDRVFGICDAPSEFLKQLHRLLDPTGQSAFTARCYGLNHLSWLDRFSLNGEDVTKRLLAHPRLYLDTEMRLFDPELIRLGGNLLPNEYLYFYYYPEKTFAAVKNAENPRGRSILSINRQMDEALAELDIETQFDEAFQIFMEHYNLRENSYFAVESGQQRPVQAKTLTALEFIQKPDGGSYSAVALSYINAKNTGKPARMVLSLPNEGAIDGLADSDVVEVSCTIDQDGVHRDRIGSIPDWQMALVRQVKLYERYAMDAILQKDQDKAIAALMAHPLVASYPTAKALTDVFFKRYQSYLGF